MPCNCNDNWVSDDTGNCDPDTGKCLKCIFNTEGDHCEHCEPGYHGNAVGGICEKCTCNLLGTDPNNFDCDRVTGVCNCLPNVVGDLCERYVIFIKIQIKSQISFT